MRAQKSNTQQISSPLAWCLRFFSTIEFSVGTISWNGGPAICLNNHDIGKLLRNWRHSDGVLEDLGQIGFLLAVCWRIVATPQT